MDSFARNRLFSHYEESRYIRYKEACIELGRNYMCGLASVESVVAFVRKAAPPRWYPGIRRTLRLIRLGCYLAQREGPTLASRTSGGHIQDTHGACTPQLWDMERAF